MLLGRTKHILYIKIQASCDNNRISFFKKEEEKRKQIFLLCVMAFLTFVCIFIQLKSVYIVIRLIAQIQLSVSIIGALASLIRLLLTVRCFTRRNLFILNKFLISGKILITCRELYFEVGGHVYLIIMGYLPEKEIFNVKDHVQNDTYS